MDAGPAEEKGWRAVIPPHFVAGAFSGVCATLSLHPLDLVKVRFQAQDSLGAREAVRGRPRYTGVVNAFRTIARTEGLGAFYQGVSPNAVGAGMAWGCFFYGYDAIKKSFKTAPDQQLSPQQHMGAALLAGGATLTATNPIWVVKTRMCLHVNTPSNPVGNYRGLWHGLRSILAEEGIRGLYHGFVPGLAGTVHGSIQFVVYEELKLWRNTTRSRAPDAKLPPQDYLVLAAVSKAAALTATYPTQVLRTRLQNRQPGGQADRQGVVSLVRNLFQAQGISVFYRGIIPNLLRVTPATCITFVAYENVSRYLQEA